MTRPEFPLDRLHQRNPNDHLSRTGASPPTETMLDRAIAWLSPRAGARRYAHRLARFQLRELALRWEAASQGRRTAGWNASNTGPNEEAWLGLDRLRARSRDLVRNNGYASSAVDTHETEIVGTGIVPEAMETRKSYKRKWDQLAAEHLGTTAIDPAGDMDFYGQQSLAIREVVEAGECLMRRRWRRPGDNLPLPFQIQLLEADHIDTSKHGQTANSRTIQGVEYDLLGRVQAYWLFPEHPGDSFGLRVVNGGTYGTYFGESFRVPADDVIHFKRLDRIGQVRGIPWGAPTMLVLRDFDDFLDAHLLRQKIAACFTAFVHDLDSAVDAGAALDSSKKPVQELEPGTIRHLPPGKTVEFARPPGVEDILDYSTINLRSVAAGYGVTYEQLTGDLKGVSFSGGRLGMLKFRRRNRNHQRVMVIPKLAKAWRWFGEAGVLAGAWPQTVPATWTTPGLETIDPLKETQARKLEVRSGFKSLAEAIREMGYDPDKVFQENATLQDLARDLGLVLESLPAQDKGRQDGASAGKAKPPKQPAAE